MSKENHGRVFSSLRTSQLLGAPTPFRKWVSVFFNFRPWHEFVSSTEIQFTLVIDFREKTDQRNPRLPERPYSNLRDCADRGGKILTIHSVRAAKIVLDMLEMYFPQSRGKAVLHWFTGTKAEAERAVQLGAYFSINREMFQNDRHRSMVSYLPLERILTETDGPFAKTDGRDATPADISRTVEELASVRSIPGSELAEMITGNLKRLVSE